MHRLTLWYRTASVLAVGLLALVMPLAALASNGGPNGS
jgi:hypothetical protein